MGGGILAFVCGLAFFASRPSHVAAPTAPEVASVSAAAVSAPTLTTSTWGIFDPKTGKVIEGSDIDTPHPIASVAKLFTAYATLKSERRTLPTRITWADVSTEGRAGKLESGDFISLEELLYPLLIESSNDAGVAIERALDSDFATLLDELKTLLKLSNTSIVEATGLDPKNVSTVSDLAKFYYHLLRTYPHVIDITKLKLYMNEEVGLVNNDPARSIDAFSGGKHGYTEEANRTFLGTFTQSDGADIGIVLLGSGDLVKDIEALLTYAQARATQ